MGIYYCTNLRKNSKTTQFIIKTPHQEKHPRSKASTQSLKPHLGAALYLVPFQIPNPLLSPLDSLEAHHTPSAHFLFSDPPGLCILRRESSKTPNHRDTKTRVQGEGGGKGGKVSLWETLWTRAWYFCASILLLHAHYINLYSLLKTWAFSYVLFVLIYIYIMCRWFDTDLLACVYMCIYIYITWVY